MKQSHKRSQLSFQPFPVLPGDLPEKIRNVLGILENKLIENEQARVLIKIELDQSPGLFLACMERLLYYTEMKRILVLTSASSQPTLENYWRAATSREDGQLLIARYPTRYSPHIPIGSQTRVCIATVRELQLQQNHVAAQLARAFGIIIAYDFPAALSPVWTRVVEHLGSHPLIAFCEEPEVEVIEWFGDNVISGEGPGREQKTQQHSGSL